MMVIADAEKPLVVAGIMGSVDAEVDDSTTDIVLESAWFHPGSVRATARLSDCILTVRKDFPGMSIQQVSNLQQEGRLI